MGIKIIKSVVFILAFAIFFGLIILITEISSRTKEYNAGKNKIEMENEISLGQPLGSNIKDVLIKDNYMYILITGGKTADRIVVQDIKTGKIISNISVN